MRAAISEFREKLTGSRPLLFVISIMIGILLFNIVIGIPKVGIMTLDTAFMSANTKNDIVGMLRYAGNDNSIKAVVIIIDSPGGEVSKIEEIYLEVLKLKAKKPVVASVDANALSGGYYIASAADFIFVKPSSEIGNIGVISTLPESWKPENEQITTGPFKISGKSRMNYIAQMDAIKQAFLISVISQRGDRLKLDAERLSSADIFLGAEGVKYGLADSLGTGSDAIRKAAEMAYIANYDTVNINKELNITFSGRFHGLSEMNGTSTPANYFIYEELEE